MSPLHKLLRLPACERRLLFQAWLLLVVLRVGLWLVPFRTIQSLVFRLTARRQLIHTSNMAMERIGWAVTVASVYVPFATCLPQALAAQMLLRWHGYSAKVRIGVAHTEMRRLEAHAWVECAGQIVIGGSAETVARYTPLPSFPLEKHHAGR
jgi:hypothetical protein